jgi:hypothetical protein
MQVNTVSMIVFHECLELSVQTSLVEHDQVIEEPAPRKHVATGNAALTAPA